MTNIKLKTKAELELYEQMKGELMTNIRRSLRKSHLEKYGYNDLIANYEDNRKIIYDEKYNLFMNDNYLEGKYNLKSDRLICIYRIYRFREPIPQPFDLRVTRYVTEMSKPWVFVAIKEKFLSCKLPRTKIITLITKETIYLRKDKSIRKHIPEIIISLF